MGYAIEACGKQHDPQIRKACDCRRNAGTFDLRLSDQKRAQVFIENRSVGLQVLRRKFCRGSPELREGVSA